MAGKNKKESRIVLTGGGTTGHVAVNLALIPELKKENYQIDYLGSKNGIEKELISAIPGVTYHSISTGKFRRGKSLNIFIKNLGDIFRIISGIFQSIYKIGRLKPQIVFSKGGFVSVPVILGAWINRIPSLTHESDLTPGLANRLVQPFVKKVFTTFPETTNYIRKDKGQFLGPIVRDSLKNGDKKRFIRDYKLSPDKPILLVMGGSQGAHAINNYVRQNLDSLLEYFQVIHQTGKGGLDQSKQGTAYLQFEYINDGLNDLLAAADMVVTRSGSNAIFEFLYYQLPMFLIPYEIGSRGDQIDNARSFEKEGFAKTILESKLNNELFLDGVLSVYKQRDEMKARMSQFKFDNTLNQLIEAIEQFKK